MLRLRLRLREFHVQSLYLYHYVKSPKCLLQFNGSCTTKPVIYIQNVNTRSTQHSDLICVYFCCCCWACEHWHSSFSVISIPLSSLIISFYALVAFVLLLLFVCLFFFFLILCLIHGGCALIINAVFLLSILRFCSWATNEQRIEGMSLTLTTWKWKIYPHKRLFSTWMVYYGLWLALCAHMCGFVGLFFYTENVIDFA